MDNFEEISMEELLGIVIKYKTLLLKVIVASFSLSIVIALSLQNYYMSSAVLMIQDESENQGLLSQYSGLASIAGIKIGGEASRSQQVIAMIKSRDFFNHLITFEDVLPSIMAPGSYDPKTKQLSYNSRKYDEEKNQWLTDGRVPPNYLKAHRVYLSTMLNVYEDKRSGFVVLEIEHLSPVFAQQLLNIIIREVNSILRDQDLEKAEKALNFLQKELTSTSLLEIREAIHNLTQAKIETQMIAKIDEDYVLKKIEPPYIPDIKSRPSRSLIVILGTAIGTIFGLIFILINHYRKREI